jgi:hypothetical protein
VCDVGAFGPGAERGRGALSARASRPAHAVDKILRDLRQVIVHHVRDAVHVNSPRRHVRRNQHAIAALLEAA